MRESCIDMLYAEVAKHVPISREAYGDSLHEWYVEPIMMDGKRIGVGIMRGTEIHAHIVRRAALTHARRILRLYLAARLERHGFLTTRSFEDATSARFLERLGFYKTGADGATIVYRLDKLKIN